MNLLAWVVLGIIAGAIAKAIYPGRQGGGILSTMVLGIIGALLGGTLVSFLSPPGATFAAATLSIPSLIIAVIGAIIAIFLWGLITGRSSY
ncbi:GlsB/YeaQ/YmgE family stress response membrane protein [Calothrix membranacea FACHB-236]|nr:GlsB/YeaQ/YmgE family stress response membrane protein [Calothrix membranacea FACHB-236]